MPTWVATDDDNIGFMGGVLGRAKKVLFPDVEEENNNSSQSTEIIMAKKTKSRGARRARLAASNSSLVNIASCQSVEDGGSVETLPTKVRVGDNVVGGRGKENKVPKPKRGGSNSQKMDSLVASATQSPAKHTSSLSMGSTGVVNVHRRKNRSSKDGGGLLSVCSEEQNNNVNVAKDDMTKKQPPHQSMKATASEITEQRGKMGEKGTTDISLQNELNISSTTSLMNETTYSMADIESSFTTTTNSNSTGLANQRKKNCRKKGGRCKQHPVSSMVQSSSSVEETKAKSNKQRNSAAGLSSLMALPASTQKTQRTSSVTQKKDRGQAKKQQQRSNTSCATTTQEGSQSTTDDAIGNVSSLTNHVESLNVGGNDCSTPLTIRHRSKPGGITSPPGFLVRFSTLSNNNSTLFPDRSPMPDSNPNMKKKFDSKKTPDKMTALSTSTMAKPNNAMTSPPSLVTKMAISPNQENDDSGASMMIASPRVTITSSSFVASPIDGGGTTAPLLSDAKSNLFSSSNVSTDQEEGSTQDIKTRRAGSAVTMETATPRLFVKQEKNLPPLSPRGPVRGSAVMEIEVATVRKESKASGVAKPQPRNNAKDGTRAKKKEKSTARGETKKKVEVNPRVTAKGGDAENDTASEPTRRSCRQSKPTDRLTVASWKKKDGGNSGDKPVTLDNSIDVNESIDDELVEEEAGNCQKTKKANVTTKVAKEKACVTKVAKVPKQKTESSTATTTDKKSEVSHNSTEVDNSEEWSSSEIAMLRNAQKNINPTSVLYWQEVAVQVGTKSSSECQSKWQSMVATPKVRRTTKKKEVNNQRNHKSGVLDASISYEDEDDEEEDDLFNSSPYREADLDDENDMTARHFSSFGSSTTGLSPCIKPKTNSILAQEEEKSALKFRRKGYNTYIENLRKDINRVEKKKKAQKSTITIQNNNFNVHGNIHADLSAGENQMSGKLLPNGIVKFNMKDESCDLDEDDIWGDVDDEEEDLDEDDLFSS